MATLAELLKGYTPPTESALADPIKQHFKTLPAQTAANLLRQRQNIDQALIISKNGIEVGNQQALNEFMSEVPGVAAMTAYHGTPHTIQDKFDIRKVGTGEGAQAYGHGMYFAENPKVATEYRKSLSGRTDLNQQPSDPAFIHAVESFRQAGTPLNQIPTEMKKAYKSATEKDIQLAIQSTEKGNLYKVDIPDADIPNMMDYYKPLSEQPKAVQDIAWQYLKGLENQAKMGGYKSIWDLDGGDLYGVMQRYQLNDTGKLVKKNVDAKDVSDKLLNAGIPGIKYLDEGSRDWRILTPEESTSKKYVVGKWPGGGKEQKYFDNLKEAQDYFNQNQTSNHVVFDPSTVKILEQNGQPTRKQLLEDQLNKVVE